VRHHARRQDLPGHHPDRARRPAAKVKDFLANRLDKTVFVKADARARYEKVVEVVDNLRAAGVDQLGLLTEQARTTTSRPQPPGAGRRVVNKNLLKEQFYVNGSWRGEGRNPTST
jgi:hypothetical protein